MYMNDRKRLRFMFCVEFYSFICFCSCLYAWFVYYFFFFFFFKQKTAYEISECDWSSDVCSSDLSSHKQKTTYEISECDWSSDVCSSDLIQKSRMPSSA